MLKRTLLSLVCTVFCGIWSMAGEGPMALRLLKRIPFSEVVNHQGKALLAEQVKHTDELDEGAGAPTEQYGFIRGGKAFTPGWGGWTYVLETGEWKQEFPPSLGNVRLSRDGSRLCGTYEPERDAKGAYRSKSYGVDTETGEQKKGGIWDKYGGGWSGMLHPDNMTIAGPTWGKPHRHGIEAVDIGAADVQMSGETLASIKGFTANGKFLVVIDSDSRTRLIDTQTMKLLPPEAIPIAEPRLELIINRDASLLAGGYGDRGATFVWDRKRKAFLWEKKPKVDSVQVSPRAYEDRVVSWGWGIPSAFSSSGQFLLCEGVVVRSDTGELAFDGLKGKRGKFSPDGRSLVTADDEAFYIYTLPMESEPIFGVFQKPEPWSPPKAPARKPKGKAKTK